MTWSQPPENTHASLVEAMQRMDGVEFDLRLTADDQLVVHHDHKVSISDSMLEGRSGLVEEWTLAELEEVGFASFEKLMGDKDWLVPWQEHSKVACLEIKRCHPDIEKNPTKRMARVMELASEMVDEAGIHQEAAVFYAFHRPMDKVAKISGSTRPWSRLLPLVPRRGSHNSKRIRAAPEFIANSFARLMRSQKKSGAPMMPCAIDYFEGVKRFTHLGLPVGLHGRQLKRLNRIRKGFPVYVWPTSLEMERAVIEAGLTALTDFANPAQRLPDGGIRWLRPATMPLDEKQWSDLARGIEPEEVAPWHEVSDEQLGWKPARIIGHRGCGKTPRPVINPGA